MLPLTFMVRNSRGWLELPAGMSPSWTATQTSLSLAAASLIRLATGESSAAELLRLLSSSAPLVASTWRLAMALTRRVTAASAIISNGEPHLFRVVSLVVHAACRQGII